MTAMNSPWLGQKIRAARLAHGHSQRDLAEKLGYKVGSVSSIEMKSFISKARYEQACVVYPELLKGKQPVFKEDAEGAPKQLATRELRALKKAAKKVPVEVDDLNRSAMLPRDFCMALVHLVKDDAELTGVLQHIKTLVGAAHQHKIPLEVLNNALAEL